jgi:hypothetical protein
MTVRQADTHPQQYASKPDDFAKSNRARHLSLEECAKVRSLCTDVTRLGSRGPSYRWSAFGGIFFWFERLWSLGVRPVSRDRSLPALNEEAMRDAGPRLFAADYETFDALSVRYGGLFRGSVIVNYLLGVVAVAITVVAVLPLRFASSADVYQGSEHVHWVATFLELLCIAGISVVYCLGRTPHAQVANRGSRSHRHGFFWRVARRWRERWLEYRLLAERFRYIELLLAISPQAATAPPFETPESGTRRWYDEYFAWRTDGGQAISMSASDYQKQALALMVEQVEHHTASSARRGSIAERLERFAVRLFFVSLVLCLVALLVEFLTPTSTWAASLNEEYGPWLFLGAVLVPTLSAAIHGILATTEYTKLAESSRETASRIASLAKAVKRFQPGVGPAIPEALKPIHEPIRAFADAAINEASGWRATLHDKNVPLA